jgi:hypothetical protein
MPPSRPNGAGRQPVRPGLEKASSPSAAVVPVPEPVVLIVVAGGGMGPAFALAMVKAVAIIVAGPPEVMAVVIVAQPEMPRVVLRRLMPPWPARMVLEPGRPRLRLEVPARRMPMMPELRAVMHHDAEIERGHHIRVDRGMPVGGCWRRQEGAGAKRGSDEKMPVHGSSPNVLST